MCSAGSKLLVQESIFDRFITKVKERMSHLRVGDGLDKATDMGPLVDQTQVTSVSELVESARKEGAEVWKSYTPERHCELRCDFVP